MCERPHNSTFLRDWELSDEHSCVFIWSVMFGIPQISPGGSWAFSVFWFDLVPCEKELHGLGSKVGHVVFRYSWTGELGLDDRVKISTHMSITRRKLLYTG